MAANRDEFFRRPSIEAAYWKEAPHVLGGRDVTTNREGGTWLGISKYGKIAMLTNFRKEQAEITGKLNEEFKSRGNIVADFLKKNPSPEEYLNDLINGSDTYTPFNVLLGEFNPENGFNCHYGNNIEPLSQTLEEGTHGLSNAEINCSWTKVQMGKQKFTQIISEDIEKESLIDKLFLLMKDNKMNFPDHGGSAVYLPEEFVPALSSIFVEVPTIQYGTRSITVILVDKENMVTFVENTMTDPLNQLDPEWKKSKFEFQIEDEQVLCNL